MGRSPHVLGLSEEEFWDITPAQFAALYSQYIEAQKLSMAGSLMPFTGAPSPAAPDDGGPAAFFKALKKQKEKPAVWRVPGPDE